MHVHAIVKLGGAALTNKHEYESLRPDVLRHAARTIKQLHQTLATTAAGLCLVHGAGSFGHFDAHTYQIARGGVDFQSAMEGFVRTRWVHCLRAFTSWHYWLARPHQYRAPVGPLF
jgi:isopentenyl phosphate kinase